MKMMHPDDPPSLTVGTEVSAKYKGAFCEAKVNKVEKNVKVKVTYKQGIGSSVLADDSIKGVLKIGAQVKAFHCDKSQFMDCTVNKIQDCSLYTVVFDDGDITTLRRNSLCLKSGRHFAESETLDQLPLTHPEHFGTPVVGGRRGRRSHHHNDSDSGSSEEESNIYKKHRYEWASDIGRVVCVEISDKKKQKDNWFPGLVVAPTAQDTVKIETKKDYLVRSFQDGRYYTVPKKEALRFNKDVGSKVSNCGLKAAVEKALQYINHDDLPPHWDRDLLFGFDLSEEDSHKDSDTSDDEPREEKDHFVAQLYKYMEECGTPINKGPTIGKKDLDLYKFYKVVQKLGGYNRVMNQNQWRTVAKKMGVQALGSQAPSFTKSAYKRYLHKFDDFYRKLGCTMVSSPKSSKVRHRSGRSLIRDCDRAPRSRKKDLDNTEYHKEDAKLEEEEEEPIIKKVEVKEVEKIKEETRSSRTRTPTTFASRMSPCRDKLRTPRLPPVKPEPKVPSVKKEVVKEIIKDIKEITDVKEVKSEKDTKEVKVIKDVKEVKEIKEVKVVKKEESASEEESETGKTRSSLRNREEQKEKEESNKKLRKWPSRDPHQRSTSCNSNSSGTSCSSVSLHGPDAAKATEKKLKVTRGITVPTPEELKKRGRRRKISGDLLSPLKKTMLPPGININVGDKLLVLYGPNRDEKITYEAKVLKVDPAVKKQYYVHYLGWNTRYDEWVERSRVAQNQTWRQTRSKKAMKPEFNKERKDGKPDQVPTSSPRSCSRKRSRSGSLSIKEDRKSEKSDSSGSSSQTHNPQRTFSSDAKSSRQKRLSRAVLGSTETTDSEDFDSEIESEQNSQAVSSGSSQEDKNTETFVPNIDIQQEFTEEKPQDLSSCGKDIDLKAIESEMKGLDKPVKKENSLNLRDTPGRTMTIIPGSLTFMEKKANPVKKAISVKLVPAHEIMGQIKSMSISEMKKETMMEDDIYEFKEPEPFEIGEIRSRKELKSKTQEELDMEGAKPIKIEERPDFPHKKSPKDSLSKVDGKEEDATVDSSEPILKIETNKELKDYTRRVDSKDHPKVIECKKEEAEGSLNSASISSSLYEVLNQGRQSNIYSADGTTVGWISEQAIPFELDSEGQKLSSGESDKLKGNCYGVDIKIDPVPIKSSEPDFITPLQLEYSKKLDTLDSISPNEVVKTGLSSLSKIKPCDKSRAKGSKNSTGHILPAQVSSYSHGDTKSLAKSSYPSSSPIKVEERSEGKLLPFSQRQQHIFPHLLNRTEICDDKNGKQKSPSTSALQSASSPTASEESHPVATTTSPSLLLNEATSSTYPESTPSTSQLRSSELKRGQKLSNSDNEKVRCEPSSIEETIEAVVHKARQDQIQADDDAKTEPKLLEKRRRNPGRLKKIIAREYHADTSEESENDCRYEILPQSGRPKRLKMAESSKCSPAKRAQRLSVETEKQFSQKCDEDDKANDADEEDNESTIPMRSHSLESSKRKLESGSNEEDDKCVRSPKRKRRAILKKDDSEEISANLLCEETFLPGSPMTLEVLIEGQGRTSVKQEMPFASVPTGSSFDKRNLQPQQSSSQTPAPGTKIGACKEHAKQSNSSENSPSGNKDSRSGDKSVNANHADESIRKRRHASDEIIDIGAYGRDMLLRAANHINDRIAAVENTPPTTPDSLLSTSSESPQRENESSKTYDTGKSGQSSELELDNKLGSFSEDSNTMDSSKSYSRMHFTAISSLIDLQSEDWDTEDGSSSNNQQDKGICKRLGQEESTRDLQETVSSMKRKRCHISARLANNDMSHGLAALSLAACASGRSRYNFCQELDPDLDASKRISVLQNRMQECRRIYLQVKNELAVIERRKKKIRKKIREKETGEEAS